MKKIFFTSILMLFSASVFSQLPSYPIVAVEKFPARFLKIINETKCPQSFLIAGVEECKCGQYQEDFLTNDLYVIPGVNADGMPGFLELDAFSLGSR